MIGACAKLMRDETSRAVREHHAELIQRQIDHVVAMQRSLLAYARGEAAILAHAVDLPTFADRLRSEVEVDLCEKGIELNVELHERGVARFDSTELLRALHNLVRNASEAIGSAGGNVTLQIRRARSRELVIACVDTGPGLSPSVIQALTKRSGAETKRGAGGLGLAIVKRIAEAHGGTLKASSTKNGTTFTITLPQGS